MQTKLITYFMLNQGLDVIPTPLVGCQFDRGVKNHNILFSINNSLLTVACFAGWIKSLKQGVKVTDSKSKSEI